MCFETRWFLWQRRAWSLEVGVDGIDDDRAGEQEQHGGDAHPIAVGIAGRYDGLCFTTTLINRASKG